MAAGADRHIAVGLTSLVGIYIVARAALVPITYDEAATFFHYVRHGTFLPGDAHWDANNHILNSALTIVSNRLFGDGEFALRLPNVLGGLLFLLCSLRLSTLLSDRYLRWTLLLALIGSRFVIEFFSLSRGYGLSLGLMMLALYAMYRWMTDHRPAHLFVAILSMQLATLANLSLLITDLLMLVWAVMWTVTQKDWLSWQGAVTMLFGFMSIGLFAKLGFDLKDRGLLYYGVGDSLYEATVRPLLELGAAPFGTLAHWVMPIVAATMAFCLARTLRAMAAARTLVSQAFFVFLLIGGVIAIVMMHHLLGVNYPKDRVAVHFLLLFTVAAVFLVDALSDGGRVPVRLGLLPLMLLPISFTVSLNTTHSVLWHRDASAKVFYDELHRIALENGQTSTVAGYRMRLLPFCYYNYRNGGLLSPVQAEGYQGDVADFQIVFLEDGIVPNNYEMRMHDRPSDLYLMVRAPFRPRIPLRTIEFGPVDDSTDEFIPWFGEDIDTLRGRSILWQMQVTMPKLDTPFEGWLAVSINDSAGNTIFLERIVIDWLRPQWSQGQVLDHHILVPDIPAGAAHMKVYLWNIRQRPISIGPVRLRMFSVDKSSTLPPAST
jgi:hypothetical protein